MKPPLHDLSHEIAREQIAHWRLIGWKVADAASALNIRHSVTSWRDVESALAIAWRRLPLYRRFEKVAA